MIVTAKEHHPSESLRRERKDTKADLSSAIYGTILAIALIAGGFPGGGGPLSQAVGASATVLIFWAAYVHSHATGQHRYLPVAREAAWRKWPMLVAAAIPIIVLVVSAAQAASYNAAINLALVSGVATLFALGLVIARRQRLSFSRSLIIATVDGLLGVAIVVVKVVLG